MAELTWDGWAAIAGIASALAALITLVLALTVWWSAKSMEAEALAARLEKDYVGLRNRVRAFRLVLRSGHTRDSPLERKLWYSLVGPPWPAAPAGNDLSSDDKSAVEDALTEYNCFWDRVMEFDEAGLLPSEFFNKERPWQKRARLYLDVMEPLHMAFWYAYGFYTNDVPVVAPAVRGGYYMQQMLNRSAFRRLRYIRLEMRIGKCKDFPRHLEWVDAWFCLRYQSKPQTVPPLPAAPHLLGNLNVPLGLRVPDYFYEQLVCDFCNL